MIELSLVSQTDAERPFIARLCGGRGDYPTDAAMLDQEDGSVTYSAAEGIVTIEGVEARELEGDIVLVHPGFSRAERLLRAGSEHNTLLVTERCDQLCVMCSQPPKKTHVDRFDLLEQACLLAEDNQAIGITGGEPTLYKDRLLAMLEHVLTERPDLSFHVLTNAQHFSPSDIERLRQPLFRKVTWGIPLYASNPELHDKIVGKVGAFRILEESLATLALAGARIELRTVLLQTNHDVLPALARYVGARLRFLEAWSLMQLENIGFARNRWPTLYVDHRRSFSSLARTIDEATLHRIPIRLFNFPRCTVPEEYRYLALPSISDWKRKYAPACSNCTQQQDCSGFFEWHPYDALCGVRPL